MHRGKLLPWNLSYCSITIALTLRHARWVDCDHVDIDIVTELVSVFSSVESSYGDMNTTRHLSTLFAKNNA